MAADPRLRRAPHAGRASPSSPTATYEADDVLEDDADGPERDVTLRVTATVERRRLTLDFAGTDAQVEGNLNCPLAGDAVGRVLRRAGAHRPRRAAFGGRATAPIEVVAPRGLPAERAPAGRGGGRQRRDLEPRRRPGDRRALGAATAGARPGPGDDEQPDARRRGLHLLRDARRRPGRLPRRRRAERRARRDVEHPQHPDRGARVRVPGAGPRARGPRAAAAAPAATAAATGSCARSRRWRRCASR